MDQISLSETFDFLLSKTIDFSKSQVHVLSMMKFDQAIDWYVNSHRTAEDVERATGVGIASQRMLQKNKIFSPVPQAERTAKRLLFNDTLMRLAIVGELNRSGIPLIAGAKIIHADMWVDDFQISVYDPFQMFVEWDAEKQRWVKSDSAKGDRHGFYDRKNPVAAHEWDQHFDIINNRFVFSRTKAMAKRGLEGGVMLGELSPDKTDFVIWQGHTWDHIIAGEKPRQTLIDDSGLWKKTSSKKPTKADKEAADFALENPVSKLSVNAGMALRAALRRLLFIDK